MLVSSCSTRALGLDLREGISRFGDRDLLPWKRSRSCLRESILLFVPHLVPGRVGL